MINIPFDHTEIPLFHDISSDELNAMLSCLHSYRKIFRKGEIIIMEQDAIQYTGIILSGTVHMMKEDIWGRHTLLADLQEHETIGELFAVQKEQSSYVSFYAATDVEILFVATRNIIHSCPSQCAFHEQLTLNMFDLIGKKSLRLMEKIEITSKPILREKIMAYLSIQSQKQHSRYFTIPLGRSELADYIGANRSALTRELSLMRDDGLIDYDQKTFRIFETETKK